MHNKVLNVKERELASCRSHQTVRFNTWSLIFARFAAGLQRSNDVPSDRSCLRFVSQKDWTVMVLQFLDTATHAIGK